MATQAQIDANRRNAANSTGPRTEEGKATVARNAVTHGFYCHHLILPGEDESELQALRQSLYARFDPIDDLEKLYAERFVVAAWKLRRLIASDQKCLSYMRVTDASELIYKCPEDADRASKHAATLERAMDKALAELTKLQKNRPERATETASNAIVENKPNLDSQRGLATSVASAPPDTTASMKIEIVKTNPIPPARTPENSQLEGTNPIQGGAIDPNA